MGCQSTNIFTRFSSIALLLTAVFVFVGSTTSHPARAAVNEQINFQGKLTNPDGTNVANGSYSVRFRIYTDPSADAGSACAANSCQWEETKSVVVADGIFRTSLGDTTSLASVNFNNPTLYLALKVSSDNEMTPRIRFTSSPYAFNSSALNGLTDSNFVKLAQGVQTDSSSTNGSIVVDKTGTTQKILDLRRSGANALSINNDRSALFNGIVTMDTSSSPVTINDTNGLNVDYAGGAAAVEGAGMRIDHTPGTTSGGTWSGLRIVSATTGATTGVTQYGLKIEGPSTPGAGTETGIRIASGFDIGADIGSGGLQLAAMSEPSTPAVNALKVYASNKGGRTLLNIKGPSGVATALQPALFSNKIAWWTAQGNSTTVNVINMTNTTTGTATTRNVATTNLFTATRRVGYVSAAGTGTSAGTRHNASQYWAGNAPGLGGYFYVARFGVSQAKTNMRIFVGMNASTAVLGNANPSTNTNIIGFACDAADSNLSFMHNDASGAATKDTLTPSFPCQTANTDFYEIRIFMPPNGDTVYYSIENLVTGDLYNGSANSDLPADTTFLSSQMWINTGTSFGTVALDVSSQYVETDN